MQALNSLIIAITKLPAKDRTREHVSVMKRAWARDQDGQDLPTNITLFKTYKQLVDAGAIQEDKEIANLFKKRSIRSMSGIVPVQVLTKPFRCPGKCIFCPNDASMPKSYINTQPGAMRALLNNFDPYKQTYNRLLSLTMTGHETDKIEMIVLGGTWDVYPKQYKIDFVKGLYDACNSFTEFLQKIDIDYDNPKAARYTRTEDFDLTYPATIQESIKINETADHRIIGLTVETRPEYVTDENCQFWRELGVTRLEMGIQTLHNDVHEANVRGHDNAAIREAMHRLRQYGFKVSNHYMPGLYTSTPEKDLETFQIAFSTPWIKSDELKFYPTAVIPNTPLYDLFKSGEYTPIEEDDLKHIIRTFKTEIIPPYARIKRLARDFDSNEVVAGANTPNLRQLVMRDLMQEFREDLGLRVAQYERLRTSHIGHRVSDLPDQDDPRGPITDNRGSCQNKEELLTMIKDPLYVHNKKYTSLSDELWDIDERMETICVGGVFDTESERHFVCLCTRCREVRNKKSHMRNKKTETKKTFVIPEAGVSSEACGTAETQSCLESPDLPFLVVRRYRSSVGEELFISFEDRLGYLYGFTRLLLPDVGETLDYPGLGASTALIRELHVYGSLQSIKQDSDTGKNATQHIGFGRQLIHTAEQIASVRGYERVSIIAGVGVRKYYEKKLGYELEGTYMVKNIEKLKR